MSTLSRARLLALATLAGIAAAPIGAIAAESAPFTSKRTVATLVSDADSVTQGKPLHLALRLRLAPGWHTYWLNPGDAGVPPNLDLTLSGGSEAAPIQWPVPQRIAEGTLTTYAYTGDVVLPFELTPGAGPFAVKAHAEWLACRDICVPEEADLDLSLPTGAAAPSAQAAEIDAALAAVPRPAPFASTFSRDGKLTLSGPNVPTDIASAEFFPSVSGMVEKAAAQTPARDAGQMSIRLDPAAEPKRASAATPGVIALKSTAGVVSAYSVLPKLVTASAPAPLLLPLLMLALAGGLVLNLMPCVFPILAMKALALTRLSGAEIRRVRAEAASYTVGVVASFVALGAGLIAFRAAGEASGWGFQFQSPLFVTGIAWLLFAIGLSFSGVFVVGGSLMGRGDALSRKGGHLGSFLTGVLAVVVASPCTAPFMGTAIAGALALPSASALAVFAALGLGLALPYTLVALIPRLSRLLPRPGAWMRTLQQLLAFPMYAAAVWLIWVLSQEAGPSGVLTAGAGLVAIGFGGWALGFAGRASGPTRHLGRASAVIAAGFLAALLYAGRPGSAAAEQSEPFTTARLEQLRVEGRPVFVDMTASWCLSCLINERLALSAPAVQDAFSHSHVVYLKGDWTNQNPAISTFLQELGHDGVPLYVMYAPGRAPVVLPQLLTEQTVLNAIDKLKS